MSKILRAILSCVALLGMLGLPACESTSRTETAESFTGQTGDERTNEPGQKPARIAVKGLNGPA